MKAWLWTANPDKWGSSGALRSYLESDHQYVYWATPKLQNEVRPGDRAYIWKTKSRNDPHNGIVARGRVKEQPKKFTGDNADEFECPEQLGSIGWDEAGAKSRWKTGITIENVFWARPLRESLMVRETINRVSLDSQQKIDRLLDKQFGA